LEYRRGYAEPRAGKRTEEQLAASRREPGSFPRRAWPGSPTTAASTWSLETEWANACRYKQPHPCSRMCRRGQCVHQAGGPALVPGQAGRAKHHPQWL